MGPNRKSQVKGRPWPPANIPDEVEKRPERLLGRCVLVLDDDLSFNSTAAVVTAGFTVAVAGAMSMAAGAYIGAGSEAELRATEDERRRFLGEPVPSQAAESPMASALVVGIGYFAGAVVPVLPVLFGATGLLPTIVTAGAMIVAVSAIVAFI